MTSHEELYKHGIYRMVWKHPDWVQQAEGFEDLGEGWFTCKSARARLARRIDKVLFVCPQISVQLLYSCIFKGSHQPPLNSFEDVCLKEGFVFATDK